MPTTVYYNFETGYAEIDTERIEKVTWIVLESDISQTGPGSVTVKEASLSLEEFEYSLEEEIDPETGAVIGYYIHISKAPAPAFIRPLGLIMWRPGDLLRKIFGKPAKIENVIKVEYMKDKKLYITTADYKTQKFENIEEVRLNCEILGKGSNFGSPERCIIEAPEGKTYTVTIDKKTKVATVESSV